MDGEGGRFLLMGWNVQWMLREKLCNACWLWGGGEKLGPGGRLWEGRGSCRRGVKMTAPLIS